MALSEDRRGISDAWEIMVLNDAYVDAALRLIDLEPDSDLGPTTLFAALRLLSGAQADAARALASRLVAQHAAAVFGDRFVELVRTDAEHSGWHEAVKDEALAATVGAIAGGLGKQVLEVKDKHGRKA